LYKSFRSRLRSLEVAFLWVAAAAAIVGALAFRWEWAIWPMYLIVLATCVLLVVEGRRVLADEQQQTRRGRDEAPVEAAAPRSAEHDRAGMPGELR
jgi:membrane protein implicated in regulation of membrane protease activity